MTMRKMIAVLATVLLLCGMLPLGALSVTASENLLVNGGFETGDFTGWDKGWYNPAITDTVTHSGNYAMETAQTASLYQTMIKSQKVAVEANTDYTVTFWYYYEGSAAAPSFYFFAKNGGNSVNLGTAAVDPAVVGEWTQATCTFNTGDYTEILLLLQNKTVGDGGVYYFDDIVLTRTATGGGEGGSEGGDEGGDEEEPENLLKNGDFETGDLTHWINLYDSCVVDFDEGYESNYALDFQSGQWHQVRQDGVPVEKNTHYVLSAWIKNAVNFTLLVKKGNDSANIAEIVIPNSTEWAKYELHFDSANETSVCVLLMGNQDGAVALIDNVVLEKGEGELPDVPPTPEPGGENILTNGDFETGDFTGWDKGWYNPVIDSSVVHGGKYALKTTQTASMYQTMIKSQKIAVEANTDYTVTFWYYYEGSADAPAFYFFAKDGGNSANLGVTTMDPATSGEWTQATCTFNTGTYTEILLLLQNKAVGGGGVYYFDDITLVGPASGDGGDDTIEPDEGSVEMLENGDFETGDKTGWTFNSGTRMDNQNPHGGRYGAVTANTNTLYQTMMSQFFNSTVQSRYVVTFWYMYEGDYHQPSFYVFVKNGDKTKDLQAASFSADEPNTWYRAQLAFNSDEYEEVAIFLQNKTVGAGGSFYFDDFSAMGPAYVPTKKPSFDDYITNGDLEMGDTTGFVDYTGTEASNVVAHGGEYALKSVNTASKYQTMTKISPVEVNPDTNYRVTFWYYYDGQNAEPSFYLYAQDVTNQVNIDSVTVYPQTAGAWHQATLEFNTGEYMQVSLVWQNRTVGDGGTYYLDDIVMSRIPDDKLFDDGYLTNGGFETGDKTGWTIYQETVINAASAHDGAYGAKLVGSGSWGSLANQVVKVTAGNSYDVSMWIRVIKTGVNIEIRDSKGGVLLASTKYSENKWNNLTFRVTPATGELYINLFGLGGGSVEIAYLDSVAVMDSPLLSNGNFEAGDGSGWTVGGSTAILPAASYDGTYGAQLAGSGNLLNQSVAVEAGTCYVVSMWVKTISGGVNIAVKDGSASGSVLADQRYTDTVWSRLTYLVTPTTNTLYLGFTGNSAADTVHLDNVSVTELYDDGFIRNGNFESGTNDYWTTYQGSTVSADAAYQNAYGMHLIGDGGWGGMAYQDIATVAGKTYSYVGYFKALSVGVNIQIVDVATDKVLETRWFNKTEWTKVVMDFTATGATTRINICGAGDGVPESVYADDQAVIELKEPSFDGYLYNGDFEAGSLTKWEYYSSTELSTEAAFSGDFGVRIKGNGDWGGLLTQRFNIEPGKTYRLTMRYKAVTNGVNMNLSGNSSGKLASDYFDSRHNVNWNKLDVTFESGYNTTLTLNFSGSGIGLSQSGAGTKDEVWVDDIRIENLSGDSIDRTQPLSHTGVSIRDTVDKNRGLAFRFSLDVSGALREDGNVLVPNTGDVKLYKYSDTVGRLVETGAIVSNDAAVSADLTIDSVDGKKTVKVAAKYLMDWSDTSIDFAVRVIDIPQSAASREIYARPYYIYELDGQQVTLYGDTVHNNYAAVESARRTMRVLFIGDERESATIRTHLYDVLKSAVYDQIILGVLCADDNGTYTYHKNNDNGKWVTTSGYDALTALQEERWEYIVVDDAQLIDWVKANKTETDAQVLWHLDWEGDYAHNAAAAQAADVDGVIPVGTALQNLASISMEGLYTDGAYLSNSGAYTAALTWFAALTGESLDTVTYRPAEILAYHFDLARAAAHAVYQPYAAHDLSETVLFAGGDFQPPIWENGVVLVQELMGTLTKQGYGLFDGFFAVGDYASSSGHDVSTEGLRILDETISPLVSTNKIYSEGNHDAPTTVGVAPYGNNDPSGGSYGVFVVNEENYSAYGSGGQAVAKDLDAYFDAKLADKSWGNKPIFVLCHVPLHYSRRTVDEHCGATAMPMVDALNEAGAAGLNIIFLFGHNHSSAYDDYLGGGSIYLKKGDSMFVPTLANYEVYESVTLNFTYMNAGYVNNYADHGTNADTELTMTTFRIREDGAVIISRYDYMGLHNLKSRGKVNKKLDGDLVPNETVYDTPRIVTATSDEPYVEE